MVRINFTRVEYSINETRLLLESSERGVEHFNFVASPREELDTEVCSKCHFGAEVGTGCIVAKCLAHKRVDGEYGFYTLAN